LIPTAVGFGVLALFFPLWLYSQHERHKMLENEPREREEGAKSKARSARCRFDH
jgi:hypothetical protein